MKHIKLISEYLSREKGDGELYHWIKYIDWLSLHNQTIDPSKVVLDYLYGLGFKLNSTRFGDNSKPRYKEKYTWMYHDEDDTRIDINCLPDDYYIVMVKADGVTDQYKCDDIDGLKELMEEIYYYK